MLPNLPTKRHSSVKQIVAQVERDILNGKYRLQEQLPSLATFAQANRVSYGTARAAVASLAQRGMVAMQPGRGTFVLGKHPYSFSWLWLGRESSSMAALLSKIVNIVHDYPQQGKHRDVTLNMTLQDVRNIPAPSVFAEACRNSGIRGLLVTNHGQSHLPYVDELASIMPVVSLFARWESKHLNCVMPDAKELICQMLDQWKAQGAKRIGYLTSSLDHPNYRHVFDLLHEHAPARGLMVDEADTYIGSVRDAENWSLGRLMRPDAPRHWVTAMEDFTNALDKASSFRQSSDKTPLEVLTFAVLPTAIAAKHVRVHVGQHDVGRTIETGIERLKSLVRGQNIERRNVPVPLLLQDNPDL